MEEHAHADVTPPGPAPGTAPLPAVATGAGAQQPLPFDPLPFDDEADRPIPFALTARARRTVAPDALPPLEVVGPVARVAAREQRVGDPADGADGQLDDPTDTRPARARALRRAGVPVARIAAQLGVDDLAVRAWTGDVTATPADGAGPATTSPRLALADDTDRTAHELARAAARDDALQRLGADPAFAAGVGLLAALAEIDTHAVTIVSTHPEVVARSLTWLAAHGGVDPDRVRVVLRLGPDAAGDLARHRWATALGLSVDRISHTRWRGAPAPDATEALVRLHDPALAASVAGWRDALLDPPTGDDPADVAF
jgi:hypothetical protein